MSSDIRREVEIPEGDFEKREEYLPELQLQTWREED